MSSNTKKESDSLAQIIDKSSFDSDLKENDQALNKSYYSDFDSDIEEITPDEIFTPNTSKQLIPKIPKQLIPKIPKQLIPKTPKQLPLQIFDDDSSDIEEIKSDIDFEEIKKIKSDINFENGNFKVVSKIHTELAEVIIDTKKSEVDIEKHSLIKENDGKEKTGSREKVVSGAGTVEKEVSKSETGEKEVSEAETGVKEVSEAETGEKEGSEAENNKKKGSDAKNNEKKGCSAENSKKDGPDAKNNAKEGSDAKNNAKEGSDAKNIEKEGSEAESSDKEEKDQDESDDDQEKGLLDRPVEVSGCRARKQVQRLDVSFSVPKDKRQKIDSGRGQKLGTCPRIDLQLTKRQASELKNLHRVLFGRPGTAHEAKRNIRSFSGFPFEYNSNDYHLKHEHIGKFSMAQLKKINEVLDLEVSGKKYDIVNRLLHFLMEPRESGKTVPKKKSSASKRKESNKKSKQKLQKKMEVDDEDEYEEDEIVLSSSEEDESEEEKSKPKSKSIPKGKKILKVKVTKPVKKEPAKAAKRKRESSSDYEPYEFPSDPEIAKLVTDILDNANLQEITMKKVIRQVFDSYPGVNLTSKKAFIKTTIKTFIA